MTLRAILIAALCLGAAGCASEPTPMWTGPDISQPLRGLPAPQEYAAPSWVPPSPDRAAAPQRRLGSGAPPDLPRGPMETIRPPTQMPLTSAPGSPSGSPSPLDGPGFQRTGPIAYGPGGTYNSVGSTIFGPGGKVCTPVGSSLTCL
jgi:hypothetical protein